VAAAFAAAGCDGIDVHAAGVEGSFERTLTVTGPVDLDVRTGSGDIQVRAGSDNSVHVTGHITARPSFNNSDAQQRVDQIKANPPVTQNGNAVHIGVTGNDSLYQNVSISYEVVVPANAKVQARSGSGDIGVALNAAELDARTGSGDINVLGAAGSFSAQTGSGDVHAGRIAGPITASTGSGSIDAEQTVQGPVQIKTGSGDVTLKLASDAAFSLSVRTGSGSIHTSHPIADSSRERNRLEGFVRGGGPAVEIKTGSGDVTIN
jgi:DUF4097 and DUF4098 domain-containing protein YvlB